MHRRGEIVRTILCKGHLLASVSFHLVDLSVTVPIGVEEEELAVGGPTGMAVGADRGDGIHSLAKRMVQLQSTGEDLVFPVDLAPLDKGENFSVRGDRGKKTVQGGLYKRAVRSLQEADGLCTGQVKEEDNTLTLIPFGENQMLG